jgi:branched-chain amino acid aminotransferase
MVAEASVANVFVFRRGELCTPPPTDGALEGITRATVLEIPGDVGLVARERTLGRFDLFGADEVFLAGSGAGIVPVRSLDGQPVGHGAQGQVYKKMKEAFAEATVKLGTPF